MQGLFTWARRLSFAACVFASISPSAAQHPAEQWEMALEVGHLQKVRNNSPLDYEIVPAQIAWRSPAFLNLWESPAGARLLVRHRIALIAETFLQGAEDYYLAFAGAPSFELWSSDRKSALFYEIGGGFGVVNSRGVPGGQGQDFTFNWFTQLGVRRQIDSRLGLTAGAYFTHHSNLGMTNPNPGIDVFGYNLGIVWTLD